MTKRTLLIILGLWVAIVPLLGFPINWIKGIVIVSGLIIALLSFINAKGFNSFK